MELQQLRYFRAIAEHGSMSRAARALGVRQPTLTVAIRHLETELRATLFNRNHSGVALTEAGQAMLEHAKDVLPLAVGDFAPLTIPVEFGEDSVFGGGDEYLDDPFTIHGLPNPPSHLGLMERFVPGNKDVHLQHGRQVDDIETAALLGNDVATYSNAGNKIFNKTQ